MVRAATSVTDASVARTSGRVLLASCAPDALAAYLRRVKLTPHTNRTIVSKEKLSETLTRRGIKHVYRPSEGAHTFNVWREYFYELAPLLFRGEQ